MRSGVGFGLDAVGADQAAEQLERFAVGEDIKRQVGHTLKEREGVAAGDHHPTAGMAWQQRTHLGGVAGVVQHQQEPPAAGEGAVVDGGLIHLWRNGSGVNPEAAQQVAEGLEGLHRLEAECAAVQVQVELPIGELVG